LLLNIGGHLTLEPLKRAARVTVFIDDDPGYTQSWYASGELQGRLDGHDFTFTYGENIGSPECAIPTSGIDWRPTRPPVVLEEWPVSNAGDRDRLTTVASWRGAYGRVANGAHLFGQKAHEFRKLAELPGHADQQFEIALDIHPGDAEDIDLLAGHGWQLVDPVAAAGDIETFRSYVQSSGAECSAAQGIYVETGSGWFSDRTAHYLASGKPALVQETGFARKLPVGEGLVSFATLEDAVDGARRIERDYESHAQAARSLVERFFDSDLVLGRLLEEVGL
jgi:hypothetical protein